MKKMLLSGILTLGLGILMANEPVPSVKFITLEGKQFGFLVRFDTTSSLQVRFLDEAGHILMKDLDTTDSYSKRFNLQDLESGKYQIEIESNDRVFRYPVKISRGDVIIKESDHSLIVKPKVTVTENTVRVRIYNLDFPVRIRMYDAGGNKLFQNDYVEGQQINSLFNLSNLEHGHYRLKINYSNLVLEENVVVNN